MSQNADQLVPAIDRFLKLAWAYRANPIGTEEEYQVMADAWADVIGLAVGAGLDRPRPLEDAGFPVQRAGEIYGTTVNVYHFKKLPGPIDQQNEWMDEVRHLRTAAEALAGQAASRRKEPRNASNDPGRPAKRRAGRPRKGESAKDLLVIGALVEHHGYQPGGSSVKRYDPAKTADLAESAGVSTATVSRFLKKKFPKYEHGYDGYVAICNGQARYHIGMYLALWQGDVTEGLAALLPHESGRGKEN
jgi:hypothetical protein